MLSAAVLTASLVGPALVPEDPGEDEALARTAGVLLASAAVALACVAAAWRCQNSGSGASGGADPSRSSASRYRRAQHVVGVQTPSKHSYVDSGGPGLLMRQNLSAGLRQLGQALESPAVAPNYQGRGTTPETTTTTTTTTLGTVTTSPASSPMGTTKRECSFHEVMLSEPRPPNPRDVQLPATATEPARQPGQVGGPKKTPVPGGRRRRSSRGSTTTTAAPAAAPASAPVLVSQRRRRRLPPSPPPSPPPASSVSQPPQAERFEGINGARLLASTHIVLGHLYQMGALGDDVRTYAFSWGFTWVPWYFMLSGFILTHTHLARTGPRRRQEGLIAMFRRRTAAVYPPYAATLLLALLLQWWRGRRLPEWHVVASQAFLVQSFAPWLPERSVQIQCWFLSCLVPYWLCFGLLMRQLVLRLTSVRGSCIALVLLALPPWAAYALPAYLPDGDPNWYTTHQTGKLDDAVDYGVVTLKFHPACYVHIFCFGMVLARLRLLLQARLMHVQESPSLIVDYGASALASLFHYGASLGLGGLLIIFNLRDLRPTSFKLSARLSILMPLQGLLLIGLCPIRRGQSEKVGNGRWRKPCWHDPVLLLLEHLPIGPLQRRTAFVSYSQYLLQFVIYGLWPRARIEKPHELCLFFVTLIGTSYVCAAVLVSPASRLWHRTRPTLLLVTAGAIAFLGGGACAIDEAQRASPTGSQLDGCGRRVEDPALPPPHVVVAERAAMDMRLNWTSVAGDYSQPRALINPNLLWLDQGRRLVRAARAHAVSCAVNSSAFYLEQPATELTTTWHSDLAYDDGGNGTADGGNGSAPIAAIERAWAGWDVASWGLDGAERQLRRLQLRHIDGTAWGSLCESPPQWFAHNATVLRTVVSGAEDPKLLSFPPSFASAEEAVPVGVAFSSMPPTTLPEGGSAACGVGGDGTPSRYNMFHSVGSISRATSGYAYAVRAARLACGSQSRHEKNWIGFTHAGSMQYVYAVYPHMVVTADAQGRCLPSRYIDFGRRSQEVTAALERLATIEGVRLHGSGSAAWWDDARRLALFHVKDHAGGYVTLAYLMEAQPPFAITNVSRPLPLQGGNRSFASGLAIAPGGTKVVVTYGVADTEARALVMSRAYLASLFDWSGGVGTCSDELDGGASMTSPSDDGGSFWAAPKLSMSCFTHEPHTEACARPDRALITAYAIALLALALALVCCMLERARAQRRSQMASRFMLDAIDIEKVVHGASPPPSPRRERDLMILAAHERDDVSFQDRVRQPGPAQARSAGQEDATSRWLQAQTRGRMARDEARFHGFFAASEAEVAARESEERKRQRHAEEAQRARESADAASQAAIEEVGMSPMSEERAKRLSEIRARRAALQSEMKHLKHESPPQASSASIRRQTSMNSSPQALIAPAEQSPSSGSIRRTTSMNSSRIRRQRSQTQPFTFTDPAL